MSENQSCNGLQHSMRVNGVCQCVYGYIKVDGVCVSNFKSKDDSIFGANRSSNWITRT